MAFKLPNNVLQLSGTSGTSPFTFSSTVAGYAAWSAQLSNGDTAPYFARDSSAWEVGLGTWASGPATLTRSLIASSTGSLISWPGTGTREVGCGLPGPWLLQMLDPSATPGLMVRGSAIGSWLTRTLQPGGFIGIANADGVAGDPALDDLGLEVSFPRIEIGESASIAAIWTFISRLIFDGFSGSPSVQELRGASDELMFRWRRAGANDYSAEMRTASSWRRLLLATSADKNDADLLKAFDPSAGANYSIANPGFISFGTWFGGLILNFGQVTPGATTTSNITLAKAYGTSHLVAIASQYIAGGSLTGNAQASAGPSPLTQVSVRNDTADASVVVHWLSIGY